MMTKIFPEYGKVAKCRLVGCSFGDKTELRRTTLTSVECVRLGNGGLPVCLCEREKRVSLLVRELEIQ